MPSVEILVSADTHENRVAILEDGRLAEYLIERANRRRLTGNIYRGRVLTVVPGMDAAFVDIGLNKNAYLYVNEISHPSRNACEAPTDLDVDEDDALDPGSAENARSVPDITELLHENQEILVQIYKEPIGRKGCRVTTNVSLPGRYLVLLPLSGRIGVSRRILDDVHREEMREQVRALVEEPMGAIVRTAAAEADPAELQRDYELLKATWESIDTSSEEGTTPCLLHEEHGLIHRLVRDVVTENVTRVLVDDEGIFRKIESYARVLAPWSVDRIDHFDESRDLFGYRGVEAEIAGLLSKRVWLPCGGHVVIEHTEAFTTIDVNTGRYVGDQDLEQTVYRTNLEAATEIARQVRLRDLGGIIVVDFIDMREQEHRDAVVERFRLALERDRSRCQFFELTELGLLQITRRRLYSGIKRLLTEPCPTCRGTGYVISTATLAIQALRVAALAARDNMASVGLRIHPTIAAAICEDHQEDLRRLKDEHGCTVRIIPDPDTPLEQIVEETT